MTNKYIVRRGKVVEYTTAGKVEVLENTLNTFTKQVYELVNLYQWHFDGLMFSLVMRRID
jgi:hypothetical protein